MIAPEPSVSVVGVMRPPSPMSLDVVVPAENLPGVEVHARVKLTDMKWEGKDGWSTPTQYVISWSMVAPGNAPVEFTMTRGIAREIERAVDRWVEKVSDAREYEALMAGGMR